MRRAPLVDLSLQHEAELPPELRALLPKAGVWQADLAPIPIFNRDDLTARQSIAIVVPDAAEPYKDLVSHTPAKPREIAALLAEHLAAARAQIGAKPTTVEVRFACLATELRPLVADDGIAVRHVSPLRWVDLGIAWLAVELMPNYEPGTVLMSRPQLWSAWGFHPQQTRRLFAAAARCFRAAPWEAISGASMLHAVRRGADRQGISWVLRGLGGGEGEDTGLLIATVPEITPHLDLAEMIDRAHHRPIEIGLVYVPAESVPATMRGESEDAGWEVAGPGAYPMLVPWHTPAGGITREQLEDLTAFLDMLPEWVAAHELDLAPRRFRAAPVRWVHRRSGVATEFWGWVASGAA